MTSVVDGRLLKAELKESHLLESWLKSPAKVCQTDG